MSLHPTLQYCSSQNIFIISFASWLSCGPMIRNCICNISSLCISGFIPPNLISFRRARKYIELESWSINVLLNVTLALNLSLMIDKQFVFFNILFSQSETNNWTKIQQPGACRGFLRENFLSALDTYSKSPFWTPLTWRFRNMITTCNKCKAF